MNIKHPEAQWLWAMLPQSIITWWQIRTGIEVSDPWPWGLSSVPTDFPPSLAPISGPGPKPGGHPATGIILGFDAKCLIASGGRLLLSSRFFTGMEFSFWMIKCTLVTCPIQRWLRIAQARDSCPSPRDAGEVLHLLAALFGVPWIL